MHQCRCRAANIPHPAVNHDQRYCGARAGGKSNQHNGPVYNNITFGDCYCCLCSVLCCSLKALCPDWLVRAWRRFVIWLIERFVGESDDTQCSCSLSQQPAAASSSLQLQSLPSPSFVGTYPPASDPGTIFPYSLSEGDASQRSSHHGLVERRPARSIIGVAAGTAQVVSLAAGTYVVKDGSCRLKLARSISGPARLESMAGGDTNEEQRSPEYDHANGLPRDFDFE